MCCSSAGCRCHLWSFKHTAHRNSSNVSLSLLYNKTECHSSNRGTFPYNAPCSLTYWHNKILANIVVQSVCAFVLIQSIFVFRHPTFKELLAAGIHSSSFFICQNSPLPSLYLLLFPTMLNCCDTVALERLVLKYSFLMTNEHVDRFLSLAGH